MATRRFKLSVGKSEFDVVEEAGAAVNSDTVEITVECAATAIGGARQVSKEETLLCIEKIMGYIIKTNWPPV